jgi:hypothetical protein
MIYVADLPPQQQERVLCSVQASNKYQVPVNILLAIAETEGGKPGQRVKNSNGTYDIGTMQLNSDYIKTLGKYGITEAHAAQSGCYPFEIAAWRIKKHLNSDSGDVWTRASNYHSYTPQKNAIYRQKLIKAGTKWAQELTVRKQKYDAGLQNAPKQTTGQMVKVSNGQTATSNNGQPLKMNDFANVVVAPFRQNVAVNLSRPPAPSAAPLSPSSPNNVQLASANSNEAPKPTSAVYRAGSQKAYASVQTAAKQENAAPQVFGGSSSVVYRAANTTFVPNIPKSVI